MTELRQPREVDMVPEELRYVPQVKSDIIIQRRDVTLAPTEAAQSYTRTGTNTITFNIQGHKELSQLLDTKSLYFTWQVQFKGAYPVEDVANLIEEVIISSNGRPIERIRHAQYIQTFVRGYGLSRDSKARLGKRAGFQRVEDRTVQYYRNLDHAIDIQGNVGNNAAPGSLFGYGFRKAPTTETAAFQGSGTNYNNNWAGETGYNDFVGSDDGAWDKYTRMSENLGYPQTAIQRVSTGDGNVTNTGTGVYGARSTATASMVQGANASDAAGYALMKFRLHCSGVLSSDKMLPIGFMPLTIQLRLSDPLRATDNHPGGTQEPFNYEIKRPRLHMNVCSVGQAYSNAMQQRLRGPGITLNCKMFDTYFKIINNDTQIVIPSNKQRLSKVFCFFHTEGDESSGKFNAFRSSVSGTHCYKGITATTGAYALRSYQFQVGTEVSEAVGLTDSTGDLIPSNTNVNNGLPYLEAYLRAIGAVNGHEQDTEFWGRKLNPMICNDWEGGDLLQTFLSKYFVAVYDGEKLLGSNVETGQDTEAGKDIIIDLRWANNVGRNTRVMVLIQYHCQVVMKENDVQLSF